jgi:hypothetical protein
MRLSLYLGDSPTFAIPLTLAGQPFLPGTEWGLIFTLKYDENDDDSDAIFQKASGVGIDVVGSKAYVTTVGEDTENLHPFTGVWDIRAQSSVTGKRIVVARDILTAKRAVSDKEQTSRPIYTTDAPAPFGGGELPEWLLAFDSVAINEDKELELIQDGVPYISAVEPKVQRHPFAARNQFPNEVYSHATNRSATYRKRVAIYHAVQDIQAVFVNSYVATTAETSLPETITIGARIVINGVAMQLLFKGATTTTVEPGALVKSDPLNFIVDPVTMTVAYIDTYVAAAATPVDNTKLWPTNFPLYQEWGDGVTFGSNLTAPAAAAPTTVTLGADVKGFSPVAVIGKTAAGSPFVVIVGDSIANGRGDVSGFAQNTLYGREDFGFIKRALNAAKIPFLSLSKPGDTYAGFTGAGARTLGKRLIALCGCNRMIDEYGLNDITAGTSAASIKTMAAALWADARTRGIGKILTTTKTLKTTSTDFWKTTASQTPVAGYEPGGVREVVNTWIRAGSDGLVDGFFEIADTIESGRNSGQWAAAAVGTTHTVTGSTGTTLTVTGAGWTAGQWQNYAVRITGGTGYPQNSGGAPREIMSNSTTGITLIPAQAFSPLIGVGTTFEIIRPLAADGTHPSSHAAILMAAAIDPAQLS